LSVYPLDTVTKMALLTGLEAVTYAFGADVKMTTALLDQLTYSTFAAGLELVALHSAPSTTTITASAFAQVPKLTPLRPNSDRKIQPLDLSPATRHTSNIDKFSGTINGFEDLDQFGQNTYSSLGAGVSAFVLSMRIGLSVVEA